MDNIDTVAFSVSYNRKPNETFNTRAKNLLLSMYDDIIKEAEKSGNQKKLLRIKQYQYSCNECRANGSNENTFRETRYSKFKKAG